MGEADALTIASGIAGASLMESAGRAVAEAAVRRWSGGPIVILAGTGNNGGDGWVAARVLRNAGYRVTVALHGDRGRLRGDAEGAAARFRGVVVSATPEAFEGAGVIIDALYGAGVRFPIPDAALDLVRAVNRSDATVIAVDLPSGVAGDTGQTPGEAVLADETVTFFRYKPGHVLLPGRRHCGRRRLVQIGISESVLASVGPTALLNRPDLWSNRFPTPSIAGHKYHRGHTLTVSGPAATGAARLAAEAALRVGSGLVTVASPPAAFLVNAAHLTGVMLQRMEGAEGLRKILEDPRYNAIVLGPGLGVGEETARLVEAALRSGRPTVLDADGITSFAEEPDRLFRAIARGGAAVLTPHDGEFRRLFPDLDSVGKLAEAREAAVRSNATIVWKGADTVVATPDGWAAIADNAPPWLATAGAGDVLAGMIGGLLAQGMPQNLAAAAAVWMHGDIGTRLGSGMIAEDIAPGIPAALEALRLGER